MPNFHNYPLIKVGEIFFRHLKRIEFSLFLFGHLKHVTHLMVEININTIINRESSTIGSCSVP